MINHNLLKHLTFKNIFIAALIIAILFLYTCKKTVTVIKTESVSVQKELVRVDSIMSQQEKDSVNFIIKGLEKSGQDWFDEWKKESQLTADVQSELSSLLTTEVPDTCKGIYQLRRLAECTPH